MKKVLVANRGEIAIRIFRACEELGLSTVGIYAKEDALSIHRFKAQESYQVGAGEAPIAAYLDMDDIIRIAKKSGADAIHPGYGLLSENATFARKVQAAGLTFVGPSPQLLDTFGDKVAAKEAARQAGLQTIPGTIEPTNDFEEIKAFTQTHGFPVMLKAASGGGGKGMRIVHDAAELAQVYPNAVNEAKMSFGDDRMYVEKYIHSAKHIEVQILADQHEHVIHLFERDCSVQRRNQKVVEIAPAIGLPSALRAQICESAVAFMAKLGYQNAGTVEFLVDGAQFYFIEVNPRIQVEHTITELITGVDIVQAQLLIADGADLYQDLHLPTSDQFHSEGAAIQCRITTEDPEHQFMPDTGTINTYRSPGGFGIRLDVGNAYAGAVVSPYYDSLLVKASVHGSDFKAAVAKMIRALDEFQITGVKTNIAFLRHLLTTPTFQAGAIETAFLDEHPELTQVKTPTDPAASILWYVSDVTVNGYKGVERQQQKYVPTFDYRDHFAPTRPKEDLVALLSTKGATAVADWVKARPEVLLTDTTFRDAHQSLFATRMRTQDMLAVAPDMGNGLPNLFSVEAWGGATFDVAYRYLNEDPWARLKALREALPHTLIQMLFRGSNAVGYQNYPDNVIKAFIQQAAADGIDVFRIFDSLNWLPQMQLSLDTVKQTGKIAEATMCYTGDILSQAHPKYSRQYYVDLGKQLVDAGADVLAIKDMAGLLKPQAAFELITDLKQTLDVPIHLHTHDTTGNGVATYVAATRAGVDIVDVAQNAFSGTTSQPSLESFYYALSDDPRQPDIAIDRAEKLNQYFQSIRPYYTDFGNGVSGPLTDIYQVQMPGGQYTNLQQQAKSMGLTDFEAVKAMYAEVNALFGDIIKVTPSSKVVGDMALFMLQNHLTPDMVRDHGEAYDFPSSVVAFFNGDLGQPVGGFPKDLQNKILKGKAPLTTRPGALAKAVDFDQVASQLMEAGIAAPTTEQILSAILYPDVFKAYVRKQQQVGDVTRLDSPTYFQGMRIGETVEVPLRPGKHVIFQLNTIGKPDANGLRTLYYTVDGQKQEVQIRDVRHQGSGDVQELAEPTDQNQIGSPMAGTVVKVLVEKGQLVEAGAPLFLIEAMKMETTVHAPFAGTIRHLYVEAGTMVKSQTLLARMQPQAQTEKR